jgi:formylglycine-generating enzyme required for sulfatase activity
MPVIFLLLGCTCRAISQDKIPLASLELDGNTYQLIQATPDTLFGQKLRVSISAGRQDSFMLYRLHFINLSADTVSVSNIVPFGTDPGHIYITGRGDHPLSRAHLFIPGRIPVNVVCPDNAWELGYGFVYAKGKPPLAGFSRRDLSTLVKGRRKRFETILYPQGSVTYTLWVTETRGEWQDGLRIFFQDRKLFDVAVFDNSLFERKDLEWIRHGYVMHLIMAWDHKFYDAKNNRINLPAFADKGKKLYGGNDVIGLWPTWPSLGLDQRNQFDLFRDLPGGTGALRKLADTLRKNGTRFFVCYNPWDESTRNEGHLQGLADLIHETAADGVVLDTRGASSRELQLAADGVKPGVVMYSEGMAVPGDMTGIVSGRVHNALYYVPMLNLNKFIKPDFAIFRVAELYKEPIKREFATSFFNGYGTELNIFAPGQPEWVDEQYRYLGRTSRILREHTEVFTGGRYTPLVPVPADSIWVNKWESQKKTIFTIYSIRPDGYKGFLLHADTNKAFHYVDLWHHRLLQPALQEGEWMVEAETGSFPAASLGTNNESEVDCIARLPVLLQAIRRDDSLHIRSPVGYTLRIWAGNPAYDKTPVERNSGEALLSLSQHFGRFEGDFIIQLFDGSSLLDETIISVKPGLPRKISQAPVSTTATGNREGMVHIPAGSFKFRQSHGDDFIPYPENGVDSTFNFPGFYMDKHPVTNRQFKAFLEASGYKPSDPVNFLKNWTKGNYPAGQGDFPVTYVSYEDASAYARWAGKRLPTELEWQYAAQTPGGREWPWNQRNRVTRQEEMVTETLTVTTLSGIDSALCNLGDGKPYPVGKYPAGENPFGLQDLVGCVWQLTHDIYMNGSYQYIILKGGSYFKPSSSWWYVQGGPRELHYRQYLLRVSQGFERNATVGFRCVKD